MQVRGMRFSWETPVLLLRTALGAAICCNGLIAPFSACIINFRMSFEKCDSFAKVGIGRESHIESKSRSSIYIFAILDACCLCFQTLFAAEAEAALLPSCWPAQDLISSRPWPAVGTDCPLQSQLKQERPAAVIRYPLDVTKLLMPTK